MVNVLSSIGGRAAVLLLLTGAAAALGQPRPDQPAKRVIGATAMVTEVSSGLPLAARVETGAATCSLRVDKVDVQEASAKPLENIGKVVRFVVKNEKDESKSIEAKIVSVVRIQSPAQKEGPVDHRYKVLLKLKWEDFTKEVLVTLNDRSEPAFPLIIGRNFLFGDFVVDVEKESPD